MSETDRSMSEWLKCPECDETEDTQVLAYPDTNEFEFACYSCGLRQGAKAGYESE